MLLLCKPLLTVFPLSVADPFRFLGGRGGERPRWLLRVSEEGRLSVLRCEWPAVTLSSASRLDTTINEDNTVLLSLLQYCGDRSGSWPWTSPSEGGLGHPRYRYCLTSLSAPRRCVGLARRRVGRGGR